MQEELVSKTQKKRAVEELQKLGASLIALAPAQLATLDLPPDLLAAVREAKRITSHEARRRQVQYIGRLMRSLDPAPVRAALAQVDGGSAAARALQKRVEQWRERLIGDDAAIERFAEECPGADLAELRALVRDARYELAEGRPPHAQRKLFRALRGYFS